VRSSYSLADASERPSPCPATSIDVLVLPEPPPSPHLGNRVVSLSIKGRRADENALPLPFISVAEILREELRLRFASCLWDSLGRPRLLPLPDGTHRRFSGPLLTLKPSRCISLVDERVSGRQNGDFPTRWGPAPCPKVRLRLEPLLRRAIAFLPLRRDHGGAADDRQRICRRLGPPRPRLPRARHPPLPHPPYRAQTNGKGRELNPHDAARVRLTAMLSESVAALSGGSRSRYNFSRRHGALGCRRRSGGYRSLREQRNRHLQLDG